ncbi:hypothetical protein Tco_0089847 [Tanacetum coccineum]
MLVKGWKLEPETKKDASNAEREVSYGDDEFNTSPDLSSSDDAKKEIKLEDLSKLILNVEVDFMNIDSPEDDTPIIIQYEDEEQVNVEKVQGGEQKETQDALASQPPSPKSELKDLKKGVYKMEIELPGDLKDIPTKLEKFNSTILGLTTQVSELRTLQWELSAEFLTVPGKLSSVQAK